MWEAEEIKMRQTWAMSSGAPVQLGRGRMPFTSHGKPQKGTREPGGVGEPWRGGETSQGDSPRKQPFSTEGPREAIHKEGATGPVLQRDAEQVLGAGKSRPEGSLELQEPWPPPILASSHHGLLPSWPPSLWRPSSVRRLLWTRGAAEPKTGWTLPGHRARQLASEGLYPGAVEDLGVLRVTWTGRSKLPFTAATRAVAWSW